MNDSNIHKIQVIILFGYLFLLFLIVLQSSSSKNDVKFINVQVQTFLSLYISSTWTEFDEHQEIQLRQKITFLELLYQDVIFSPKTEFFFSLQSQEQFEELKMRSNLISEFKKEKKKKRKTFIFSLDVRIMYANNDNKIFLENPDKNNFLEQSDEVQFKS